MILRYSTASLSRSQDYYQLHKEAVLLGEENTNTKLILQDRDESRKEDRQVFYNNVEVPVPEPGGDIVTVCVSIGLAVMKPLVKVFCHKKARVCSREIQGEYLFKSLINPES